MEKVKLGEIAKVTAGQAAPKEFSKCGLPFIRAGHLEELINGKKLNELPSINDDIAKKYKLKKIAEGSILFAKSGMSATMNRIFITTEDSYFVSHLAAIIPSPKYDTNYLARYLSWFNPSNLILDNAYPSIRLEDINNLEIPLPPLATQQKIAAILDQASAIIANNRAIVEKYDAVTQSLFLEMFGDPVKNEKGWEKVRFDELVSNDCPLTYGIVQPGEEFENGIPCVRPVDLTSQYIYVDELKRIDPKISSKFSRTLLKGGELLLSVRGSVGIISIADISLIGSNVTRGIVPIWFDSEISNKLFFYYLYCTKEIQREVKALAKGATLIQINLKDLRELRIIKPPVKLQNQFAERVQAIEAQKQQAQLELAKSEELFNSLLQKAFKGELN